MRLKAALRQVSDNNQMILTKPSYNLLPDNNKSEVSDTVDNLVDSVLSSTVDTSYSEVLF